MAIHGRLLDRYRAAKTPQGFILRLGVALGCGDEVFSPSPCTRGEGWGGWGEGSSSRTWQAVRRKKNAPHPGPLPEYREKGECRIIRDRHNEALHPCVFVLLALLRTSGLRPASRDGILLHPA